MKYYVRNGTKKYDNVQNEDKGWYRNWAVVIELTDGQKYVAFHNEHYYWEGTGWETSGRGPTYWEKLKSPNDFFRDFHQVGGEECSEACEALWYKFKEEDKEKSEMEKATNSKTEFLKSLETDNAHSSITKEMINDMKKKYENTPVYNIKKVMEWLLEGKEVVYCAIEGGTEEWNRLDPEKPILDSDLYKYQLAENAKSMWTFRVPDWHFEASSREDALQKAYTYIMENPASIVVYPGAKGDPLY